MTDPWVERATIAQRYELVERLGERTWRARDPREDRSVVLRWERDEQRWLDRYARLERAHMLAGTVVAAAYDRGREGESWWISREYLEGATLDRSLKERWYGTITGPSLANAWFAETLRPIAQSLARLHRAGIAHGALWPEHVVSSPSGARFLSVERGKLDAMPPSSKVDGAPQYLSPSLWQGHDARVCDDLWALGLIAFELLAGRAYWKGRAAFELATEALTSVIEAPSVRAKSFGVSAALPKGFDDWFLACVSRDEARGYADGDEALDALEVLVLRSSSEPGAPGPCLKIAPPVPCLNVAPPIPCLSPVRPPPQPCLKVAPKMPGMIVRLREAWDEHRAQREREREEQERARQQNEHRDNPYRGVILRAGEGTSRGRRRAVFVGVAVSAAVIAWWLAKRC
ncbi:MAG: hypothetical protein U0269_36405 [Polyangiales bacterium]